MFHSLGAEQENDASYIVVRVSGTMTRCQLIVSLGSVSVKLICILGLGHSRLYM